MKGRVLVLAGALALALMSCAKKSGEPTALPSGPSYIALERDFQHFREWKAFDLPEHGPQGITHVAGKRREYINHEPHGNPTRSQWERCW